VVPSGPVNVTERIADFNKRLVIPLYEEIRTSSRMASKGRNVGYVQGVVTGDAAIDEAMRLAHPNRGSLRDLARAPTEEQKGEWVGHTLVILESPELRAQHKHLLAGHFFLSVVFRLPGDGRVLAAPLTFYWMRFDDKLHAFTHRYDKDIADHPIEGLSRKHLLQQALDAISFFDLHAFSPTRPW